MFKHVLIPTDGSELSVRAVHAGVQFAKALSARVTAITVSAPFHVLTADPMFAADTPEAYRKDCEKQAPIVLDVVRKAAEAQGVPYDGMHVFADHPYVAIIEAAQQKGCDAIFMASHGRRGMAALILGSETGKVLTHSTIPVLVWR